MEIECKNRIAQLRKEKGKTIAELSDDVSISASAISNYERGLRSPDAISLIKLAKYFDCSTDYLLGATDYVNQGRYKDYLSSKQVLNENFETLDSELKDYFIGMLNSFFVVYSDYKTGIQPDDNDLVIHLTNIIRHYSEMIWNATEVHNRIKTEGGNDNKDIEKLYCLLKTNTEKTHAQTVLNLATEYLVLSAIGKESDKETLNKFAELYKKPYQKTANGNRSKRGNNQEDTLK